jgi:hypothetical protein
MYINKYLIFVIFGFAAFVYCTYTLYQLWFEPKRIHKRFRDSYYRMPGWSPFKSGLINYSNDEKFWINSNRLSAVFAELFITLFLVIVAIAWVS